MITILADGILLSSATQEETKKTNESKTKKEFLIFTIQDHGIGVPKSEQKNLFQQFNRASNARNLQADGTGLGLYIVKKIIKQHNGSISMFSKGENMGTKFRVCVPRR